MKYLYDKPNKPSLNEVLCHVCRLQPENMLFLDVVTSFGSESMINTDSIGTVSCSLVAVFIVVQVQGHVPQRHIEHLPASFTERCYNNNK